MSLRKITALILGATVISIVLTNPLRAQGPVNFSAFANFSSDTATVAIHVSEATSLGWNGIGSEGGFFGNAHSQALGWKYWHIYGFLMEQLRSNGTPFKVVSDADIRSGILRNLDGSPSYQTFFSLSNTCVSDEVATEIDAYVLAGGYAVVGGTSWRRGANCKQRALPKYSSEAKFKITSGPRQVIATADTEFSSTYSPLRTIDANLNNQWINAINDPLPTKIQYRFEDSVDGYPTIGSVELEHSAFAGENGEISTYSYLINEYEIYTSSHPNCLESSFSLAAANKGNNKWRERQITGFSPRTVHCLRINILSSYVTTPYQGYDTTQWVGLTGFQAFDQYGNALIETHGLPVVAESSGNFSGTYNPATTIDAHPNNLWLNEINAELPSWIQYRFNQDGSNYPIISKIAVQHSNYEERGFGYHYRAQDYDVLISTHASCTAGSFSLVASATGNNINREIQTISFPQQPVHCLRLVFNSSYETMPYQSYDTEQWVGISGFQAFGPDGNALIRYTDIAADPWKPLGIAPVKIDGCFDVMKLTPAGLQDSLMDYFEQDQEMRGYKLGIRQNTSGAAQQYHWGYATRTLPASSVDHLPSVLAMEIEDSSVPCPVSSPVSVTEKPLFIRKERGNGHYLYSASFNSLAGWSMYSSASYVYSVYKEFIEESHNHAKVPLARIGTWPWPYKAGFATRHDHYPHFGFDGSLAQSSDNTLVARIERYVNGISGGTTLRDFPVRGGYFLLNDSGTALPGGSSLCSSGSYQCNPQVSSALLAIASLQGEIGTHTYSTGLFQSEIDALERYIGSLAEPRIYASHGAYAHFDQNGTYVGVQTMADAGITTKGEDSFGAHPHFALRISAAIGQYTDAARWNIIEIPATAYSVQPSSQERFDYLGIISHEVAADPSFCVNDSTPPRSCMQKAVAHVYGLGGIINLYDHIGDTSFSSDENPTPTEFNQYIVYSQGLPFVYTTSPLDILDWWQERDSVRIERLPTELEGDPAILIDVAGSSSKPISISVDLPYNLSSDPRVIIEGSTPEEIFKCPALSSGAGMLSWLSNSAVTNGCFVREGHRIRVKAVPPASLTVSWEE